MAEKSLFWYTNGFTGDVGDGAAPYTQEEFREYNHAWIARSQANVGVFPNVLNECVVSGLGSPLTVGTGWASCYGFPYRENSAPVSLPVTTPSVGTTGGRVVLRAIWSGLGAQRVRATIVLNSDGNPAIPALVQSAGVTWDIPLATFTVTTGGVITLTDAREWALAGKPTKSFLVPALGAENVTDGTDYDVIDRRGVGFVDNKVVRTWGHFYVPYDFESAMTAQAVIRAASTGDVYAQNNAYYGADGEAYNTHTATNGYSAVGVTANENETILSISLSSAAIGDYISLELNRDGTDPSDTINNPVYVAGWLVSYVASP